MYFSLRSPLLTPKRGSAAGQERVSIPRRVPRVPPGNFTAQKAPRSVRPTPEPARADTDPSGEERQPDRPGAASQAPLGSGGAGAAPTPGPAGGATPSFPQAPPRPLPLGPGATHSVCPQTFTISFKEGLRYLVVLHRGQPKSSMAASSRSPPSSRRAFRLPVPPPNGPAAAQRRPARSVRAPVRAPTPPARAGRSPGAAPALSGECPGPRAPGVTAGDGGHLPMTNQEEPWNQSLRERPACPPDHGTK